MHNLIDTETVYARCFSEYAVSDNITQFWDDNLPNMYSHNFTLIKEHLSQNEIIEIIKNEIEIRKNTGKSFLQLETNFQIDEEVIKALPILPQVTVMDYMIIGADQYDTLRGNTDCTVLEAHTEEILNDGIQVDIAANSPAVGNEFAQRRIARKVQIYKSANPLNLYICYHRGEPVGNCELFLDGTIAKIEDFDILEQYQRKGYGTSTLKHLIKRAREQGADLVYLITDHGDTAKDMYSKCGFKLVGQKTQLHFSL